MSEPSKSAPSVRRTTLFDLNPDEFISSVVAVTNGVEGLARLTLSEGGPAAAVASTPPAAVAPAAQDGAKNGSELEEDPQRGLTCRTCGVTFDSVDDQREHFRLDWHRCNVKRRLEKRASLAEADFERMLDAAEVSSISGSDTDEDDEDEDEDEDHERDRGQDEEDDPDAVFRGQSAHVELRTARGEYVTLCKTLLLADPRENVSVDEVLARVPGVVRGGGRWTILMCSGGHFAGVCFDGARVVAHKTIHKYTVRRKQGGSQLAQDSTGKRAKSAGATIRRHNELALQHEVRALLAAWAPHLRASQFVFVHAPNFNRRIFFDYDETPFAKADARLRRIPFTTRRPTLAEVRRLHGLLAAVTFSPESIYQRELDEERVAEDARRAAREAKEREREERRKQREKAAGEGEGVPSGKRAHALTKEQDLVLQACRKGKADLLASVVERHPDLGLDFADERGWTPLHVAANEGHEELVALLLARGANPGALVSGQKNKTPYNFSKTREVRNAFRRQMAREPDRWDYAAAQVPSPLTEEMERAEREKEAQREAQLEKERKKKEKKKAKARAKAESSDEEAEAEEAGRGGKGAGADGGPSANRSKAGPSAAAATKNTTARVLRPGQHQAQGSADLERERRARAAEQRMAAQGLAPTGPACALCGRSLAGLVPFERLEFKYCSTKCVADHRREINR